MYTYQQISHFLSLTLCFLLLISSVSAFTAISEKGTFINTHRGVTETISQDTPETAFFNTDITFTKSISTIPYATLEDIVPPGKTPTVEKAYRYYLIDFNTNAESVETMKISFRVERKNVGKITPVNVGLYGLTSDQTWEKIPHSITYTTDSHYYFSSTTQHHNVYAISDNTIALSGEVEIPVVEEKNETIIVEKPVVDTQPTNRVYIDDAKEPNIILIIIIVFGLIILIGGTILYVIAKHKIEPSIIKSVDNTALKMKIQELVRGGKTNGEIVNSLLDEGYSLDSVSLELRAVGRMK